jgi:hypothetical protein
MSAGFSIGSPWGLFFRYRFLRTVRALLVRDGTTALATDVDMPLLPFEDRCPLPEPTIPGGRSPYHILWTGEL